MELDKLREIAKELSNKYEANNHHCLIARILLDNNDSLYYCVFGKYLNKTVLISPFASKFKCIVDGHEVYTVENISIIGVKSEPSEVISMKGDDKLSDTHLKGNTSNFDECFRLGHKLPKGAIFGKCLICNKFSH